MKSIKPTDGSIIINVERDLRKNMRTISQRLNANPELAKLVLINPILVLEDLGVQLSNDVKHHIIESLRFPPALTKRRDVLANELKQDLSALNIHHELKFTNKQRADLVFKTLQISPLSTDNVAELSSSQLRLYKDKHPILKKLTDFERYAKGALIFYPRNTYEQYKTGKKKLHWVNAIQFKV